MCDLVCLILARDWRPLSSGVVWERENITFNFIREESSFVVLFIMLVSSSFVFMLFYTVAMNSTTSLIYFILFILAFILFHRRLSSCVSFQNWKATFTSPIFSRNHSSPSKALFRARYSFIIRAWLDDTVFTNQIKKNSNYDVVYARKERNMLYPGVRRPVHTQYLVRFVTLEPLEGFQKN